MHSKNVVRNTKRAKDVKNALVGRNNFPLATTPILPHNLDLCQSSLLIESEQK